MRDILFRFIAGFFPTERIGDSRIVAAAWRILFYLIVPRRPFVMRTRDYRLMADPGRQTLTRAVIRRGYWEKSQTDAVRRFLRPGGFVIDAGANFGHYALVAATALGPDGLVLAFEPHPDAFALLAANRDLLSHPNLVAVQAGLGAMDGTLPIWTDAANPGGHSFLDQNLRAAGAPATVRVYRLDSYLAQHHAGRAPDLIKIDVQGFEARVVQGAAETIRRHRPAVLCEITPDALALAGDSVAGLLAVFRDAGYAPDVIGPAAGTGEEIDYPTLEALLSASGSEYCDVLFVPPASGTAEQG